MGVVPAPVTPCSHGIGRAAVASFRSKCPGGWPVNEILHDYGLDLCVEVPKGGFVTGREFYVQVKGTGTTPTNKTAPTLQVRSSTLNYWLGKIVPVLVVLVHVPDTDQPCCGDMWCEWLEFAYHDYRKLAVASTVTLHLKTAAAFCFPGSIGDYVERHFDLVLSRLESAGRTFVGHDMTTGQLNQVARVVARVSMSAAQKILDAQRELMGNVLLPNEKVRMSTFGHIHAKHPEACSGLSWEVFEEEVRNWTDHRPPAADALNREFVHRYLDAFVGLGEV